MGFNPAQRRPGNRRGPCCSTGRIHAAGRTGCVFLVLGTDGGASLRCRLGCFRLGHSISGICRNQSAALVHLVPDLLGDGLGVLCRIGKCSFEFFDIRPAAHICRRFGLGCCVGVSLALGLDCLFRGNGSLPVLQRNGPSCVFRAHAVHLLYLGPHIRNVSGHIHAGPTGQMAEQLHHGLALVILGTDAVIVHALLGKHRQLLFTHRADLSHVAKFPGPGRLRLRVLGRRAFLRLVLLCILTFRDRGSFLLLFLRRLHTLLLLVCSLCAGGVIPSVQETVRGLGGLRCGGHLIFHKLLFLRAGLPGQIYSGWSAA